MNFLETYKVLDCTYSEELVIYECSSLLDAFIHVSNLSPFTRPKKWCIARVCGDIYFDNNLSIIEGENNHDN